jgi:Na+-driven multidrug efflux pump
VITVQGFETVRYLQHIDRRARIAGCRLSQIVSSIVYVLLVALATPLMGLGTPSGADRELLELVERAAPLLVLPLVLCAVLSQFSATTADTEAGVGNFQCSPGARSQEGGDT